ncbi:hypothetical protein BT67DRAFT_428578 [Trichocladium antarcticum]|uniref:Uncharacterized protein n=1 Tax=Trichocladium antarcticum TaxID=1450529 RepID=A0AAN6UDP4_9PEZI|nr:hypothetical protein BT67DRAFT_428578 [Trichocladium antarcticum]
MFATRSLRMFRPTARMMRPIPPVDAAHTISQRLRRLKSIPPELFPLGVVVGFALAAAIYSCTRHLLVDHGVRLQRQNRAADAHAAKEGEQH